jgi:hypothetical protein
MERGWAGLTLLGDIRFKMDNTKEQLSKVKSTRANHPRPQKPLDGEAKKEERVEWVMREGFEQDEVKHEEE